MVIFREKGSGVRSGGDPPEGTLGIGYFCKVGRFGEPDSPGLPDPRDFVDEDWPKASREAIANLFDAAPVTDRWKGYSTCRICGRNNGSTTLGWKGQLVWPEGFSHYIREHGVRPPKDVVDFVYARLEASKRSSKSVKSKTGK